MVRSYLATEEVCFRGDQLLYVNGEIAFYRVFFLSCDIVNSAISHP